MSNFVDFLLDLLEQFFGYFSVECAELEEKLNNGAKLEDADKEELINKIKTFKETVFEARRHSRR